MIAYWTPANIPDQFGKVAIVTGGNSGLGLETVKALAAKGAQVVLACRDIGKGNAAMDEIISRSLDVSINVMRLDLADLDSIRQFAASFKLRRANRLDQLLRPDGRKILPAMGCLQPEQIGERPLRL
jgi:NAD(P)-dependent dehydrogenase (short-subunit alcohol dehydrogenase family)